MKSNLILLVIFADLNWAASYAAGSRPLVQRLPPPPPPAPLPEVRGHDTKPGEDHQQAGLVQPGSRLAMVKKDPGAAKLHRRPSHSDPDHISVTTKAEDRPASQVERGQAMEEEGEGRKGKEGGEEKDAGPSSQLVTPLPYPAPHLAYLYPDPCLLQQQDSSDTVPPPCRIKEEIQLQSRATSPIVFSETLIEPGRNVVADMISTGTSMEGSAVLNSTVAVQTCSEAEKCTDTSVQTSDCEDGVDPIIPSGGHHPRCNCAEFLSSSTVTPRALVPTDKAQSLQQSFPTIPLPTIPFPLADSSPPVLTKITESGELESGIASKSQEGPVFTGVCSAMDSCQAADGLYMLCMVAEQAWTGGPLPLTAPITDGDTGERSPDINKNYNAPKPSFFQGEDFIPRKHWPTKKDVSELTAGPQDIGWYVCGTFKFIACLSV